MLAMGYDSGPPGANAVELVRMVDGGLAAAEAHRGGDRPAPRARSAATTSAGSRPGRAADLLVVDGDPLADVRLLADPRRLDT